MPDTHLEDRIRAVVVVPYDAQLCRVYGKLRGSLPAGITIAANDLWIAACAMRHNIPLITAVSTGRCNTI